jgi:hypothetical protein
MSDATGAEISPDLVLQALLAEDLAAFTEFAFGVVRPGITFKPNWHFEAVTHKLSQVAKGDIRRLIVTLPPRTLKSLCASVALPAWFLGHYPWERVVVVSYSDFLARTHANDFRRLVNDPLYQAAFPTMRLERDTDREIMTTKRGKRITTSIDGTLTGLGGNLIIIDDPIKLGDAMSESVRQRVTLDQMGVALWLNPKTDKQQPFHPGACDRERHLTVLTIRARLKRTGIEMRMVVEDGSEPANVDPVLVRLLVWTHAIRARLLQDPSLTLREIAAEERVSSSYVSRLVRLAFIAPDILTAILNGRHPPHLTANRLMNDTRLPLDWRAQRELLCS